MWCGQRSRLTYQIQRGVEHADRFRAALADIHGKLDRKDWERTAAAFMHCGWLTDCESARSALTRPVLGKIADKRLAIEIAALQQSLWRKPGELIGRPELEEKRPDETTDSARWIDTAVMTVGCFTKLMGPEVMMRALQSNKWCLAQPHESLRIKLRKQQQRKKQPIRETSAPDGTEEECAE